MKSIDTLVTRFQLRWPGHLERMSDDKVPKQMFYSKLLMGHQLWGRPTFPFKDNVNKLLQNCIMVIVHSESTASNRSAWTQHIKEGAAACE
ncbi:hypothetical protein ElyMa_003952600 [Elysia marginata]|uniref:Uncharacterized protein n=1 Tax=Elysia marginata TaxID=1093978 RepID=A0AAV4FUA0_9GAST|nr:hypothetical protein ElyMa_003952600 [Elysia marginata]